MTNTKIPEPEYYELTQDRIRNNGSANTNLLMEDVRRGVRRLSDHSYVKMYGSAEASLFFTLVLNRTLGANHLKGKRAVMTYRDNRYVLTITTTTGFELVFTGLGSGYHGQGAKACRDILKFFGFSKKQYEKPFTDETFTVFKRMH